MSETTLTEVPAIKVRMDRSRPHSTVHGDRGPSDPHRNTHFYQNELPFDAQGFLLLDHIELQGDHPDAVRKRMKAERLVKKAMGDRAKRVQAATAEGGPDMPSGIDEIDDDEDLGDAEVEVNLEQWLRGAQQVEWNEVSQAIARRYHKRVASIKDAVDFLVNSERLVPEPEVTRKFRKFLN